MSNLPPRFSELESLIEKPFTPTAWLAIDQDRISSFASATDDRQWIHVDSERARVESPSGSTIAHGLLLLSLLPRFSYEVGLLPSDATHALNYGFDKVRFLAPVVVGSKIRDVVALASIERKSAGQALVKVLHTIELAGSDKPALVAEALIMIFGKAAVVTHPGGKS